MCVVYMFMHFGFLNMPKLFSTFALWERTGALCALGFDSVAERCGWKGQKRLEYFESVRSKLCPETMFHVSQMHSS